MTENNNIEIQSKEELKKYFETGDTPNQHQYAALINSLRHENEKINVTDIEGLKNNGLEKITQNKKTGWRLTGFTPSYYGNIGGNATDLSTSTAPSSEKGATGGYAHAQGQNTTASGNYSHAQGRDTIASGNYSHAQGSFTNAIGDYSHAQGFSSSTNGRYAHAEGNATQAKGDASHAEGLFTVASGDSSHAEGSYSQANGDYSHAEGKDTKAIGTASSAKGIGNHSPSYAETTLGCYGTKYTPKNSTFFNNDDRVFNIGNGKHNTNRNDALTVYKSGAILAPSLSISKITSAKSLITKEYFYNNKIENIDIVDGYLKLTTDTSPRLVVAQISIKALKKALDEVV